MVLIILKCLVKDFQKFINEVNLTTWLKSAYTRPGSLRLIEVGGWIYFIN